MLRAERRELLFYRGLDLGRSGLDAELELADALDLLEARDCGRAARGGSRRRRFVEQVVDAHFGLVEDLLFRPFVGGLHGATRLGVERSQAAGGLVFYEFAFLYAVELAERVALGIGDHQQRARCWALISCILLGCASHVIYGEHALNFPGGVKLRQADERAPQIGARQLAVKYLRAGGVLLRWNGEQVLTAPFFTNYPLLDLAGKHIRPDMDAVRLGLRDPGLYLANVQAILAGHSHYDHIGDLPLIAQDYAPGSLLFVNQSGYNMLSAYPGLVPRARILEHLTGWVALSPHIGLRAIASDHAPNFTFLSFPVRWAPGEVSNAWTTPWPEHRLKEQRLGQPFAFLIDFLEPGPERKVAFRVHYQDAASVPPQGYLPSPEFGPDGDTRDVDLEILCMPGRESLPETPDRYPSGVLANTRAHHALVIHYESFFHPTHAGEEWTDVRLLPNLSESDATEFLSAIDAAIRDPRPGPCRAPYPMQGLCSASYTVPLPGEWIVFDAAR